MVKRQLNTLINKLAIGPAQENKVMNIQPVVKQQMSAKTYC